jgi:hypothetical protein
MKVMCLLVLYGSHRLSSGDRQTLPPSLCKSSECACSKETRLSPFTSWTELASWHFGVCDMIGFANWSNWPSKAMLPVFHGQRHWHECSCAVAYGTMLSSLGIRRHKSTSTNLRFHVRNPPPPHLCFLLANVACHYSPGLQGQSAMQDLRRIRPYHSQMRTQTLKNEQ